MIEIKVRDNTDESFDKAVKMFKKTVNNDGILKEIQERRYFEKRSDKLRRKIRMPKKEGVI